MGEKFPTPSTLAEMEGTSSENITLRVHRGATKTHVHFIEWFLLLSGSYYFYCKHLVASCNYYVHIENEIQSLQSVRLL